MSDLLVRRINKDNPIPDYSTGGSVGIDTYVSEDTTIPPQTWGLIPLGINTKIMVPNAFPGLLPRSSTFRKTGFLLANSLGVIDPDYCGNSDEIIACVFNTKNEAVTVKAGDRLFQLVIFKVETPRIIEVDNMQYADRSGFGSTDNKK